MKGSREFIKFLNSFMEMDRHFVAKILNLSQKYNWKKNLNWNDFGWIISQGSQCLLRLYVQWRYSVKFSTIFNWFTSFHLQIQPLLHGVPSSKAKVDHWNHLNWQVYFRHDSHLVGIVLTLFPILQISKSLKTWPGRSSGMWNPSGTTPNFFLYYILLI